VPLADLKSDKMAQNRFKTLTIPNIVETGFVRQGPVSRNRHERAITIDRMKPTGSKDMRVGQFSLSNHPNAKTLSVNLRHR